VGIVAVVGLILDVGGGDGDAALALLGRLVNGAVLEVVGVAFLGLPLRDGCCKGGLDNRLPLAYCPFFKLPRHCIAVMYLSMIHVPNGTNVHMRLRPLKGRGVTSGGVEEVLLAPVAQCRGDGAALLAAQGARGAEEGTSERHGGRDGRRGGKGRRRDKRWEGVDRRRRCAARRCRR
jgi:hypothetical protein